ncbi:MAG: hypothetical protein H0U08_03705 [Actinobacteria bacterium]|nr:hypothetical protein [Actinomycetota bacterium]
MLRAAFERFDGVEVETQGDPFQDLGAVLGTRSSSSTSAQLATDSGRTRIGFGPRAALSSSTTQ